MGGRWGSHNGISDLLPDPVMRYYKCWSSTKVLTFSNKRGMRTPLLNESELNMSLQSLVISTLKAYTTVLTNAVELTAHAKTMSVKAWRNEVAVIIGKQYEVEPHKSQKFHWLTFKKDTKAEQMLEKFFKLHPKWATVQAPSSNSRTEAVVPVAVRKATKELISVVVDAGMTKAQFNKMVTEIRNSVQFK